MGEVHEPIEDATTSPGKSPNDSPEEARKDLYEAKSPSQTPGKAAGPTRSVSFTQYKNEEHVIPREARNNTAKVRSHALFH